MQFIKKIITSILTLESRLILKKHKPFIIAVTGSVGKTSTKDAIYTVVKAQGGYARKSEKSMNSDIGLPLTVIGVPNAWHDIRGWGSNIIAGAKLAFGRSEYPDCLVLEIGADHPGDIQKVARWLRPDISVITRVSSTPVHVEFFSSPAQVFEEKAALALAVKKGGSLILFADDEKVMSLTARMKGKEVAVTSFGVSAAATIRGSQETVMYSEGLPTGMSFKLDLDGSSIPVPIPGAIGISHLYPLLAAVAVGKARGMSSTAIVEALKGYQPPHGRMNLIPGMNGTALIDDTYNSSPDAVLAALDALKGIEGGGRKIAILADMMELGKYSSEEHRRAGREAAVRLGPADILVTVGQRSRSTADEAISAGMPPASVHPFDTALEAADYVKSVIHSGDIILIKGSQSTRMERAVKALMREPARAADLLVRQESEWLEKA